MTRVNAKLKTITCEIIAGFQLVGILFLALFLGAISVLLGEDLLE